jgi:YfiH family protein
MTGITPVTTKSLASERVRHGFFTRNGGVSEGVYASLNCGLGSNDDQGAIRENRRRAAAHLLGHPSDPLTAYQIHSNVAVIVDGPFLGEMPKADALVTATPGLVIGALAADCAPVLLADHQAGVVAAVHAGWRGAVTGIVDAAVEAMETLDAKRANIAAVVGPCIGQASYEVGLEFEAEFLQRNADNHAYFKPGVTPEKRQFDLSHYLVDRTKAFGLEQVEAVGIDVYPAADQFFSYRRSQHENAPDYARLLSAIALV